MGRGLRGFLLAGYTPFTRRLHRPCSQLSLQAPSPGAPGAAPKFPLLSGRGWMSLDVPKEGWQQHRGHRGGRSTSVPPSPIPKICSQAFPAPPWINRCLIPAAFQTSRQLRRFPDANVIPKKKSGRETGGGGSVIPKLSRENSPGKVWKIHPGGGGWRVTAGTVAVSQPRAQVSPGVGTARPPQIPHGNGGSKGKKWKIQI